MPEQMPMRAPRELAIGSAWMVAMRWAMRGVGLINTVILARLLAPDDFGVVAMAMVAVAILQVFAQSGVDLALLRADSPTSEHYDAAWSLEIIQGAVLATVLFVSAPLVAGKFEDSRVTDVIRVLGLAALVGGFQNIGVVDFRRNLDFRKEFYFGVQKKVATFIVTVVAAVLMRNYWALVVGQVLGRCVEVGLSYKMSSYRPRFAVARAAEIWGFSRWLVLSRFTMLISRQFDRWVVGSVAGAAAMGTYFVAQDLASAPTDEVVAPMSRAAFPVYSRLRSNPAALIEAFQQMLGSVSVIAFATGLGIAAVAHNFVLVVLGPKWLEVAPLMPWLGLFAAAFGLVRVFDVFLLATGSERASSLLGLGFAALMIPVLWSVANNANIHGIAAVKAVTSIILVTVLCMAVARLSGVSIKMIWTVIWPPLLASTSMYALIKSVQFGFPLEIPAAELLRDVCIGVLAYVALSGLIWVLRGRPAGVEKELLSALIRKVI